MNWLVIHCITYYVPNGGEQFVSDGIFNYNVYGSGTIESEGQFSMEYTVINIGLSDTTTCSVNAIRQ